jgi:O-antigen ligase
MRRRFSELDYLNLTIGAFVFAPELRRLVDWRVDFDKHNVFAVIPLLMLLPIGAMVYKKRANLRPGPFALIAAFWLCGFVYAFLIGTAHRSVLPAIYGFALFGLPALIGAWFVVSSDDLETAYKKISSALLTYGAIAGAYGIVQFVVAPPWDTAWMQSITAESFGTPVPFGIRVFSVMNSPGVYAAFTAFSLIMNLPNMQLRKPWSVAATFLMIVGLMLSLGRASWIAFAVGTILFAILSPRRVKAMLSLGIIFLGFAVSLGAFFAFFPSDKIQQLLADRVTTFGDLTDDGSAAARAQTSENALESGLRSPFGHGLGLTGPAADLANPVLIEKTDIPVGAIDNGFLSRLIEMGFPGLFALVCALLIAMFQTNAALRRRVKANETGLASIAAASLATQVAMFLAMISGDDYSGVGSVAVFIAIGLALKPQATKAPLRQSPAFDRGRDKSRYGAGVAISKRVTRSATWSVNELPVR